MTNDTCFWHFMPSRHWATRGQCPEKTMPWAASMNLLMFREKYRMLINIKLEDERCFLHGLYNICDRQNNISSEKSPFVIFL